MATARLSGSVSYRIARVIGQGAFGTVYEGERVGEGLSRRVAMKLLHTAYTGHAMVEGRLRDEARMLSLIRHRAIVGVDDLIRVDGAWCVVMEYVDGADLAELLESGPVPPRAALQIAEEVASALHAAYSQPGPDGRPLHLVHRDVKPANIRLTPRGDVKLLDFGVARAEFNEREAQTRAAGIGTIIYMAAERFRGEDTHAGDVYALGVTLFQLLTGVPPGASAADADRRPPGRFLRPQWTWLLELDSDLHGLLVAMMADELGDRPTARDCARRLSELRLRIIGDLLEDWAESTVGALPAPHERSPRAVSAEPGHSNTTLAVGATLGGESALADVDDAPIETPRSPAPERRSVPWLRWAGAAAGVGVVCIAVATTVAALSWSALAPSPVVSVTSPAVAAPTAKAPSPSGAPPTPAAARVGRPGTSTAAASKSPAPAVRSSPAAPVSPALEPASIVAPVADPPASPRTGTVTISGATGGSQLHGPDGDEPPGPLHPGSYSASVSFADGPSITVTGIRVSAGRATRVRCDAAFVTCAVGAPE